MVSADKKRKKGVSYALFSGRERAEEGKSEIWLVCVSGW